MADARIRVRCYGGLLGDCFLLRFPRKDQADLKMLIDFGVLQHMSDGEARLPDIAADIRAETGGKLDVLVITHRHWDHVCGFGKAPQFTDAVDALWMSWVENPNDPQGAKIAGGLDQTEAKLAAFAADATAALGAAAGASSELASVNDALSFTASGKKGALTTVGCLDAARGKAGRALYWQPGQSIAIDGTAVVAHVLGPPRDENRLGDQDPSADKHEVYAMSGGVLGEASPVMEPLDATPSPFADAARRPFPPPAGSTDPADVWLAEHYADAARGIDGLGAEALAFKFDDIVNNSSLVLAFELEPGGDVLLFAADAQVGNWLSWHEIKWPGAAGDFAADLLGRTVFYKVGHHGSINATARAGGLDAMTSGRLTAFIPVVESFARQKKPKPWDMPHEPMRLRLEAMTQGRIARGDKPLPPALQAPPPAGLGLVTFKASASDPDFPFYIDYEI